MRRNRGVLSIALGDQSVDLLSKTVGALTSKQHLTTALYAQPSFAHHEYCPTLQKWSALKQNWVRITLNTSTVVDLKSVESCCMVTGKIYNTSQEMGVAALSVGDWPMPHV